MLVKTNEEDFSTKKKVFCSFFQDLSGAGPCFVVLSFPHECRLLFTGMRHFLSSHHSHSVLTVTFFFPCFWITHSEGSNQRQGGSHVYRIESKFPANDLNRGRAVRKGPSESDARTTTEFCWEIKGVRLKLKYGLVNPSEQALSYEAREPKVLRCPSSISICTWLPFFLKDISLQVGFEKDIWVHKQGLLI